MTAGNLVAVVEDGGGLDNNKMKWVMHHSFFMFAVEKLPSWPSKLIHPRTPPFSKWEQMLSNCQLASYRHLWNSQKKRVSMSVVLM